MSKPKGMMSDADNRTPDRPGSISRNLLTPCRQIGLSRKRKTPRSTPTLPNTNTETNLKCDDTPLKHVNSAVTKSKTTKHSTEKSESNSSIETTNPRQEKTHSEPVASKSNIDSQKSTRTQKPDLQHKGRRSKRSNQSKINDHDYLQQSNEDSETFRPNKSSKEPACEENISRPSNEDDTKAKSDSLNKSSKSVSRRLSLNLNKIVDEPNITDNGSVTTDPISLSEPSTASKSDNSKDSSVTLDEISPPKKSKRFRRILSTKKTSSDDSIDVETSPSKDSVSTKFDTVMVELDRFDIDNIISQHAKPTGDPLPADHVDDFTSSPAEDDKWSVNDLTARIVQLEDTVKTKTGHLSHLKQVQVYQKMHDIDDLKNLFATWKKGCIQALNDLLPHLASHSEIDMATLLKNLRVPPQFIELSPQQTLV